MDSQALSQILREHATISKNMKRKKTRGAKKTELKPDAIISNEEQKDDGSTSNVVEAEIEGIKKKKKVQEYTFFCHPKGQINRDMVEYIKNTELKTN